MQRTGIMGVAATLLLSFTAPAQAVQWVDLTVGLYRIKAEFVYRPADLATGLMHRTELPDLNGMLFRFEGKGTQCMWMRNTLVPLSVAFLRDDGTIVNIADMQPQSDESHCSTEPVRYALETNQGWFASRNLGPGAVIKGIPGG